MATEKQRRAAQRNIKKAQQKWRDMTHAERVCAITQRKKHATKVERRQNS